LEKLIQELVDAHTVSHKLKGDGTTTTVVVVPFDPWSLVPLFASLFWYYYSKTEDRLEKEGKYPKYYEYMSVFVPPTKVDHEVRDIAYYAHVYPFYLDFRLEDATKEKKQQQLEQHEQMEGTLYYIPFVQIEAVDALRYYIEYQVTTKLSPELVENHLSDHPKPEAKVLTLDTLKDYVIHIQ
jgi:hypothetical protein